MPMDIAALREEYTKARLDIDTADKNPIEQFKKWFDEAVESKLPEPNAMILATVGHHQPSQRTVLMKALDEKGIVFYTNYESRKAQEIAENNRVSVLFPWFGLERQVSIRGSVEKVSKQESMTYFATRPLGSQLGAWVSPQSSVISGRSLLEAKLAEAKRKFREGKVPMPSFWGGYRIKPHSIEFWQGRRNRLHDRLEYTLVNEQWHIRRLSP